MSDDNVYGDVLSAFPELFDTYTIFLMKPKPGGGFGARYGQVQIDGIFRNVPGGKLGVQAENLEPNSINSFWCYAEDSGNVRQGSYMEVDGSLYKLTKDNSYRKESGFVKFTASIVPGPTDKQTPDPAVVDRARNGFGQ